MSGEPSYLGVPNRIHLERAGKEMERGLLLKEAFGQMKENKQGKIVAEIEKLTLCRDDFIEWILHSTNEDSEFRVHKLKQTVMVHIDKVPFTN